MKDREKLEHNVCRTRTDCGNAFLLLPFPASWNSIWSSKGVVLGNLGNSYWVRNPDLSQMSQVKEIALHLFLTEACLLWQGVSRMVRPDAGTKLSFFLLPVLQSLLGNLRARKSK